ENRMHRGYHIASVVNDGSAAWRSQRDVKHGAVLRDVDGVAPEHRLDAVSQSRLLGKPKQECQGFVGNPVLGIVKVDSGCLDREPVTAFAIPGKELPQVHVLYGLVVPLQRRPGGPSAQVWNAPGLLPDLLRRTLALNHSHRLLVSLSARLANRRALR